MVPFSSQDALRRSLIRQEAILRGSLVLNPVENFPLAVDMAPISGPLHGLYNTDKRRSDAEKINTIHQFAGRERIAYDSRRVYRAWADALGAEDASLRLLSGLQSHAAIFMSLTRPGDRLLLLPELAGGHMATKTILERLGLTIVEMAVDASNHCVDVSETLRLHRENPFDIVFIDRSEGLVYEDFGPLLNAMDVPTVFDASQYLTQILTGDYRNPFEMGASMIISTLHKNFPGPQKALIATKKKDAEWQKILSGLSTFVSNMHVASTYSAGLVLARKVWLMQYSTRMLENTMALDSALTELSLPVVARSSNAPPTHHIWIGPMPREKAFDWFKRLERARVNVNYRLLPYGQGYGLRLGLAALTSLGLRSDECQDIAKFVTRAVKDRDGQVKHDVRSFAEALWFRSEDTRASKE